MNSVAGVNSTMAMMRWLYADSDGGDDDMVIC